MPVMLLALLLFIYSKIHISFLRATENGVNEKGTATVTLRITDVAEFSATTLTACIAEASPAGIGLIFIISFQ